MRDKRWVAVHRGGQLTPDIHRQLMEWACACAERVLPLYSGSPDKRLAKALETAQAWKKGKTSVGDARKAAADLLSLAREITDPVSVAVVRAVMHAAATAHMADHAPGAALYALKAVKNAGRSTDAERTWQREQLPSEIRELVLTEMSRKEKSFNL